MSKKKIVVLVICGALLIGIGVCALIGIDISRDVSGKKWDETSQSVTITIESGATTSRIAAQLQEKGVIHYPKVFVLMATMRSLDTKLQKGSYEFQPGSSYSDILELLKKAPNARPTVKITFKEGCEVQDVIALFLEKGIGTQEGFNAALKADFGYDYLPDPEADHRLEGFLYPDTYEFFQDDTEVNVLKKMLAQFNQKATAADLPAKAEAAGMSVYEVVTLGSIIQKEAGSADDFALISSVFHNRLKVNMRLQSDATVSYVIPKSERRASCTNDQLAMDTPYNVYLHGGLPPTPICNACIDAVVAAAQPAESDYLYFIGTPSGQTIYAVTYAEHQKNIKKYL